MFIKRIPSISVNPWIPKKNPRRYLSRHSARREIRKSRKFDGERTKSLKVPSLPMRVGRLRYDGWPDFGRKFLPE